MVWPSADLAKEIGFGGVLFVAVVLLMAVALPPLINRERKKVDDPLAGLSAKVATLNALYQELIDRVNEIDTMQEDHERQLRRIEDDLRRVAMTADRIEMRDQIIDHIDRRSRIPPRR